MEFLKENNSHTSMMRVAVMLVILTAIVIALTVTTVWAIQVFRDKEVKDILQMTSLALGMFTLALGAKIGQKAVEKKNNKIGEIQNGMGKQDTNNNIS